MKNVEPIERIEPPAPLDIPARLACLALLRDGWMDGQGVRLPASGVAWLSKAWTEAWPDAVALPHAYPTPEGNVQLEWDNPRSTTCVEVDLVSHIAEAMVARTDDGEILEEASLHLDDPAQWKALVALVVRHNEAQNATA